MRISDWSSDVCSSDLHDAAHALDHEVIASPIGIRPGLSEAGDRAIDKAGIYRPQAVRIQAIFAQPPDLEILDHDVGPARKLTDLRSEEHTSELQSLMRISYAVFCLQKKKTTVITH